MITLTQKNVILTGGKEALLHFAAIQAAPLYGTIKTDEPRTLDFSGVRGFLVTNVCIVQRSAA